MGRLVYPVGYQIMSEMRACAPRAAPRPAPQSPTARRAGRASLRRKLPGATNNCYESVCRKAVEGTASSARGFERSMCS
ncbi:hypothetical protein EVAR_98105_1 [Eumeta japonica]|uniref:Uncharacterized protein n=1 Tax=Eumeta variegata TaxID=151549 RepID=A0A4C1XLF8_EUMVA|nr:hypothetical protein EVAR_98105_1 [Eumeta japonica]